MYLFAAPSQKSPRKELVFLDIPLPVRAINLQISVTDGVHIHRNNPMD
jgi:hypothetical protein